MESKVKVSGWGRYPIFEASVAQPASVDAVRRTVAGMGAAGAIARGLGRSYGDSAVAPLAIGLRALDFLLDFDAAAGRLRCAAGATLDDIIRIFLPRGWFLPVTPGTRFVTVGGAIASDVHGKNHHGAGCFSEFVDSFVLLLADGAQLRCSRSENAALFHASCGGMGLTGIVLEATLRLLPVQSAAIEQVTHKAENLDEALELFARHHEATYSVAWIDCLAHGAKLGRSLVMLGEHAQDGDLSWRERAARPVPVDMPAALLNRYSIGAFNALYHGRVLNKVSRSRVDFDRYFYPLDGLRDWNRLYGKPGFVQYQFVLPQEAGAAGIRAVLGKIAQSGRGSFLAVLKALGVQNANPLSFPLRGYTLALDFKVEEGVFAMLDELDAMVLDHGGRLYLAKDARMSERSFKQSYPRWEEFQAVRAQFGALGRFASAQSRRLGLDAALSPT